MEIVERERASRHTNAWVPDASHPYTGSNEKDNSVDMNFNFLVSDWRLERRASRDFRKAEGNEGCNEAVTLIILSRTLV